MNDKAIGDSREVNPILNMLMKSEIGALLFNNLKYLIFKSRLACIKNIVKKGQLLDFGCGDGIYLKLVKNSGVECVGVEINKKYIKNHEKSLTILPFSKVTNKKFSVITMWHVLEHLPDFNSIFKKLCKILDDQGTLIVEVPHSESLSFDIFRKNWTLLLYPQHLHLWSETSLKILAFNHNLKINKIEYPITFPFVMNSSLVKYNRNLIILTPLFLMLSVPIAMILSLLKKGEVIRVYLEKI